LSVIFNDITPFNKGGPLNEVKRGDLKNLPAARNARRPSFAKRVINQKRDSNEKSI